MVVYFEIKIFFSFALLCTCLTQENVTDTVERNTSLSRKLDTSRNITIAFLGAYSDLKFSLGALLLAVEDVNHDDNLLPGWELNVVAANVGGPEKPEEIKVDRRNTPSASLPIRKMTEMRDQGAMVFIGPDGTCTPEALVAAAWNMPMISYNCADNAVSDKNVYFTFARTLPPSSKVSKSVVSLLKTFEWRKFIIVSGKNPPWCTPAAIAIRDLAIRHRLDVVKWYQFSDYIPSHVEEMQDIVDKTYTRTRVYIFIGEHIALMDFLSCMQKHRLLETGEYVIISVDDDMYKPEVENLFLRGDLDQLIPGYRSVLKVTQSVPRNPIYKTLGSIIKKHSTQNPFNFAFNSKVFESATVPVTAAHLYDAVQIYARSLTDILYENGDIRNGKNVLYKMLNQTYHSIQGFDVYIDENGDAEGNYSVIAVQNDTDEKGITKMKMQPVGYFLYMINKTHDLPDFRYFNESKPFQWINGKVPIAEPKCGFYNEKCVPNINWKTPLLVGILSVALFVGLAFGIKHYRYEQKLACLLWKVDIKDVTIIDAPIKDERMKRIIDKNAKPYIEDNVPQNCRTTLAYYKGNIVVMRRIHKKTVDLSRTIRNELIQIRELRHENLVQIIGACVDPGNVFILMEYYARGSLQDILMNFDIKLDQMFISSLVADILRGMIYLHQSVIHCHGNLQSSNCLIDSRWVLRISDFGLVEFKANQEDPDIQLKELKRKLYRAPELLSRNRNASIKGTQKGDIYSFGILLYEIVGRSGPWGDISIDDEEIIYRVENGYQNGRLFRPNVNVLQTQKFIVDCMEKCWNQDADQRPEFTLVRELLKGLHSGLKPNIFDNMLAIMEKYSYNLEELVRERTEQLSQEKKRTEELLHEMLPPTVAETLKNGQRVIAESYDCVTIYFSDIVGFTALSAISTPLQVVDLLNELYTTCDSILTQYDVYKVETIGDAYMVVSGLPLKNGNMHAGEIASMALQMLKNVGKFKIRHIPDERLKIRIGIHSGSCVAGVIGVKMPRYCLFGDTVNTASRMEATGKPLQIHISKSTRNLLQELGGYYCVERGLVHIKGKGEMMTYWLVNEDPSVRQQRLSSLMTPVRCTNSNLYFGAQRSEEAPDLIKRLKTGSVAVTIDELESTTSKRQISMMI
ncbi:guanylate cyclase 32E [Planococcus citri]|uniref:guanylate cyclase 32E n=1 Tax=Planococcus citri TaxID=170843 RepID=UPI0031F8FF50